MADLRSAQCLERSNQLYRCSGSCPPPARQCPQAPPPVLLEQRCQQGPAVALVLVLRVHSQVEYVQIPGEGQPARCDPAHRPAALLGHQHHAVPACQLRLHKGRRGGRRQGMAEL